MQIYYACILSTTAQYNTSGCQNVFLLASEHPTPSIKLFQKYREMIKQNILTLSSMNQAWLGAASATEWLHSLVSELNNKSTDDPIPLQYPWALEAQEPVFLQ